VRRRVHQSHNRLEVSRTEAGAARLIELAIASKPTTSGVESGSFRAKCSGGRLRPASSSLSRDGGTPGGTLVGQRCMIMELQNEPKVRRETGKE
jgi:hypothetical protein